MSKDAIGPASERALQGNLYTSEDRSEAEARSA
jgi:hypothetical protein